MVRTTFGPAGQKYSISDATVEIPDKGTTETIEFEPVSSTDNGTIRVNFDSDGSILETDTRETGSDSRQTGSGTGYTDPNTATRTKRKYTRRARTGTNTGTGSATTAEKTAFVTANLEKVLYNLHKMGAAFLDAPELAERDRAEVMAAAIQEVAEAYDWTAVMNPKTTALFDLAIACTVAYGDVVLRIVTAPPKRKGPVVIDQAIPRQNANQ